MQALGPSGFIVNNRGINTRFTYGKVAHRVEVHIEYMRLYADSGSDTHFEDVKVESAEGTVTSGSNPGGLAAPQPTSDSFFATYYSAFFVGSHPTPRTQRFVVL